MIPVSLYLRNFLSYGEAAAPLDFSGFRLACLSGPNGHGKSALLDAMTWALWGQARKASGAGKPDDALVRIGASHMQVEFVFDLSGERYRTIRGYELRKSGRGKSDLRFDVFDTALGAYRSLSCKTLTETQKCIDRILRMDYTTFINSSFLLQGRADEFTRKKPSERKEILAEVLGLRRYEELRDLARRRARDFEKESLQASGRMEAIRLDLEAQPETERRLESLSVQHRERLAQAAQWEARVKDLQDRKGRIESLRIQFEESGKRAESQRREIREARINLEHLERQIEAHRRIAAEREEIEARFAQLEQVKTRLAELDAAARRQTALEKSLAELNRQLEAERHELQNRRVKHQAELKGCDAALAEIEKILLRREEIEARHREWESLKEQTEELEKRLEQASALDRRMDDRRRKIETERDRMKSEKDLLETQMRELNSRLEKGPQLRRALGDLQGRARELETLASDWERVKEEGSGIKHRIETLKTELGRSAGRAKEEREKILLLEGVQSAQCPLCRSDLDGEKQAALIARLRADLEEMARADRTTRQELDRQEALRGALLERYREMETRLKGREKLQQEIGRHEGQLKELEALREKGGELRKRFENLESSLENEKYSIEDRESLQSLMAEKERLGFDPARLKECRARLDALASAPVERRQLQEAEAKRKELQAERDRIAQDLAEVASALEKEKFGKPVREALEQARGEVSSLAFDPGEWEQARRQREQLADAEGRKARLAESLKEWPLLEQRYRDSSSALKAKEESLAALQRQLEEWKPQAETLAELEQDLHRTLPEYEKSLRERDELNIDLQKAKAERERLEKLDKEKRDLETRIRTSHREQDMYDTLAEALGPRGVQALIVENAVPEIQQEANRILARLTGNRTRVAFESLREKKTGGLIETLDIKIGDELGMRDYELYSGGEAFRTDLAIRIALSRLLARRAGTRLQTLVIDEGFGTQDAEGLESMVEAIRDIADEFEKIIVVTHLDSLKDAFPVRIEVTKSPDKGSSFTVIRN